MIGNILLLVLGIAVVVAIGIGVLLHIEDHRYDYSKLYRFFGALWRFIWVGAVSSFCAVIILAIYAGIASSIISSKNNVTETSTHDLRAIGTKESIEGEYNSAFFIAHGYIEGKQVLRYIRTEGEGSVLREADTYNSVIFEVEGKPEVDVHSWYGQDEFWLPGTYFNEYTWTFRVPSGSVVESYEIGVE